jgi:hypothetical protein
MKKRSKQAVRPACACMSQAGAGHVFLACLRPSRWLRKTGRLSIMVLYILIKKLISDQEI